MRLDLKALLRRLRDHIEHGIPLDEADLDAAAGDPKALAFVCIRIGVLHGLKVRKSLWGQHLEDWPAAFARANALADEMVVRQTRLLVYCEYLARGGLYGRDKKAQAQEGQPELAEREA
jgi:hypothetical protein